MKIILGRILSALIMAGGWVVSGIRVVLDFIGYSTLPDDAKVAKGMVDSFFAWLQTVNPAWIFGGATVSTLWLIWVSWSRQPRRDLAQVPKHRVAAPPPSQSKPPPIDIYEGAHEQLMLFVCRHILPTVGELFDLQERAIRTVMPNNLLSNFAVEGGKPRSFTEHYERLRELGSSPIEFIPFDEMMERVQMLELNYSGMPEQIRIILETNNISVPKFVEDNSDLYERWQRNHKEMVAAYEPIKQNSAMTKLFRPVRESRWGVGEIPAGR